MCWRRTFVGVVLCGLTFGALAAGERESFDLRATPRTTPVAVEGRMQAFYELHLNNFSRQALVPIRVEALGDDGKRWADHAGDALASRLAPAVPGADSPTGTITPGGHGVVYVELAFPPGMEPKALRHRVTYRVADDSTEVARIYGGDISLDPDPAVVLGPPLRGGPWAAVFDPGWARGHRRVFYAIEGRATIPGRFAIDFVKLDDDGHLAEGDADVVRNAYAYGEEVLAVADAEVVSFRNEYPEAERLSQNGPHPLSNGSGNYVVLSLGDGRHAIYEHLRPGSVRVKTGQRVRRGEVIGEVGFSGSGNWPHLHFHVADAPSLLGSEGLPFTFDRFIALGAYADFQALGKQAWTPRTDPGTRMRLLERPADNSVVRFAGGN